MKDYMRCHYCRLEHRDVEAGGVWSCPNPCCAGPGAWHHRHALESYRDLPGDIHIVDPEELYSTGLRKAAATGDKAIATAAFVCCLVAWIRRQP